MLDARRRELKAAGRKVSFTHLIAYAIARAADDMPVMANHFAEIDGKPHRIEDGQVNLGLAVDVEKRDGTRTLMVPVILDAGRLPFDRFLDAYDALVEKARTNTLTADDLVGANITLTNPGGLGTIASVPRLMAGQGTIVATGSIAYPVGLGNVGAMIGAEKVMTMTSTYDHRIIQGAESGRFLALIEEYLQGEHGFYEDVFASLGVELGPAPRCRRRPPRPRQPPRRGAAGGRRRRRARSCCRPCRRRARCVKRFRSHGHLAARLDPLGSEPEGDPGLDPEPLGLTPELQAKIPAKILHMYVPGATLADALPHLRETYCGTIAYEIEHIASHRQRVWLREHIESGAFRQPLTDEERKWLLQAPGRGRRARALHAQGLPRPAPVLDRGPGHDRADARRADPAVGGRRRRGGRDRHGPPRAAERARPQPRPRLRHDLRRVRGRLDARGRDHDPPGRHRRRQVPPRRAGLLPAPRRRARSASTWSPTRATWSTSRRSSRAPRAPRRRPAQGPHAHQDTDAAVPIVIHGDASFPGQGVVAETLNLQALDGYKVGGTVHLITNNQIGFTTDPDDARSTRWASDLAKGFDVPIIHVNADDVPACMSAVRLAFAFRQEFGHDVLIDLIGYRRFGHNESDEPAYTQPEMYAKIKTKKRVAELWAERLVAEGVVTQEEVERQAQEVWDNLTLLHQRLKAKIAAAAEHGGKEHSDGRVPARPLAQPRRRHRGAGRAAARARRAAAARARGLHRPPEARQTARAPARGARPRRARPSHRLGARRGARVRVAARPRARRSA